LKREIQYSMRKVDIIIPVYEGEAALKICMESVLHNPQKNVNEIIVVNDCSPNRGIVTYLLELESQKKITLIHNEKNLGFVQSVNKGMSYHVESDVLLLNSDTEVANDWLDRLIIAAYRDKKIGTCTPFSNNAEICSFPGLCSDNEIPPSHNTASLDKLFSEAIKEDAIDIPTAVGFCMYIKRDCLHDVGLFDAETYGRGYGEENDFCMRAERKGWRNTLCSNVFVFHKGGVSFSEEKKGLIQNAMQTLDRLYPHYHGLVHTHIKSDPAKAIRTLMVAEIIKNSALPKILNITHSLSGGTTQHVQDLERSFSSDAIFLQFKPLEHGAMALCMKLGNFYEQLVFEKAQRHDALKLISYLQINRIHIHHIINIDDEWWFIANELHIPYDVTLHDYYFINASPTLSDQNGAFVEDRERRDMLAGVTRPIPGGLSAEAWRLKTTEVLVNADRVIVPSNFAKELYRQYFPTASFVVAYHNDFEREKLCVPVTLIPKAPNEKYRIVVLGALNKEKGADLLESCADHSLKNNEEFEFHLIGYAYRPLNDSVNQHGSYKEAQLQGLIADLNPHLIWFPCLWPETYSYTLSTAIKTGRPILAPDLGAFAERLEGRPLTRIVNWKQNSSEYLSTIKELLQEFYSKEIQKGLQQWNYNKNPPEFTYGQYLKTDGLLPAIDLSENNINVSFVAKYLGVKNDELSLLRRESFLYTLYRVRQHRLGRYVARFIPFKMQQSVKRILSRKAMHDILNQKL